MNYLHNTMQCANGFAYRILGLLSTGKVMHREDATGYKTRKEATEAAIYRKEILINEGMV